MLTQSMARSKHICIFCMKKFYVITLATTRITHSNLDSGVNRVLWVCKQPGFANEDECVE